MYLEAEIQYKSVFSAASRTSLSGAGTFEALVQRRRARHPLTGAHGNSAEADNAHCQADRVLTSQPQEGFGGPPGSQGKPERL